MTETTLMGILRADGTITDRARRDAKLLGQPHDGGTWVEVDGHTGRTEEEQAVLGLLPARAGYIDGKLLCRGLDQVARSAALIAGRDRLAIRAAVKTVLREAAEKRTRLAGAADAQEALASEGLSAAVRAELEKIANTR